MLKMEMWIHCNLCQTTYHPHLKFYLTECGHLKCQKCAENMAEVDGNRKQCLICKSRCQILQLNGNLNSDIQCFFKPLTCSLDKVKEVYEFQEKNMKNVYKILFSKYNYAKREVLRCYKVIDNLKQENIKLKTTLNVSFPSTPTAGMTATPNCSFVTSVPQLGPNNSTSRNQGSSIRNVPGFARRMCTFRNNHLNPTPYCGRDSSPMQIDSSSRACPILTPIGRPAMPHGGSGAPIGRPGLSRDGGGTACRSGGGGTACRSGGGGAVSRTSTMLPIAQLLSREQVGKGK